MAIVHVAGVKLVMLRVVAAALLVVTARPALAGGYVANTKGATGAYRVFEFTEEGNPWRPVSGLSSPDAAWPSAVQMGGKVHVYASVLSGGSWSQLRRWTSHNSAAYVDDGVVFEADAWEPYGIGPATLTYDGSTYRLFYLVRGPSGPGTSVGLATSADGLVFTRQGTVYTAGAEAPGGLSVSYACSYGGTHYLFLHAYATGFATATSFVAKSTSVDGPYAFASTTISNSPGLAGAITGQQGNAFAAITGSAVAGRPIVINDIRAEPYLVTEVVGSTVYLDRPLETTHTAALFADALRSKADLSFAVRTPTGWEGAVTGYGQFPGVLSEFTVSATASQLSQWQVGGVYAVSPYFNSGERSTENPEPIRTNASCGE